MPLNHPEALLDAVLEQSELAILLFDKTGRIVFANESASRLASKNPQDTATKNNGQSEVWGKPYTFDGCPIPVNDWPVARALSGIKTECMEARMIRPDGTHYDISISAAPLKTETGEMIGAILSFTDITQRRLAEQKVTAIGVHLNEIASETARGIDLMNLIGLSAQSIPTVKEIFQTTLTEICNHMGWPLGYTYIVEGPGRLHGITAWHTSDPERYEALRRATESIDFSLKESLIGQVLRCGKPVFTPIDNELFLRRDAALQAGLKSCLAIPVTVDKRTAAILEFFHTESIEPQDSFLEVMEAIGAHLGLVIEQKRAEQKLQALFDSSPDAQIVTNEAGKILMANKQTTRLFGYSMVELLGQPVELLVPPDLRTRHIEHRTGYLATRKPRPMGKGAELKGLCKDKTEIPVEVSLSPIEFDEGNLISSAIRDVTDRKKLEVELRERTRLADIGTAAAIFAHEIGNPLAGISMSAHLIKDVVPAENHDLFDIFDTELSRLTSLLDQFRSLSSISKLQIAAANLSGLAERLLKLHIPAWHERGLSIRSSFAENLTLNCDVDKIQQVILNLCKNSVEAMPDGGTLTLSGHSSGDDVILEVTDTGSGIPEGIDIFKLFESTKSKGAGLGLYIVQQIVTAHHGMINYTTKQGEGTTFRISLPRSVEEHTQSL